MYKTYSKTFTVSLNNIFILYLHQVLKSRKVHKIEFKKKTRTTQSPFTVPGNEQYIHKAIRLCRPTYLDLGLCDAPCLPQ